MRYLGLYLSFFFIIIYYYSCIFHDANFALIEIKQYCLHSLIISFLCFYDLIVLAHVYILLQSNSNRIFCSKGKMNISLSK